MSGRASAIERFNKKIAYSDVPFNGAPCWIWCAWRDAKGYGTFYFERRMWKAHRWAYETFIGAIGPSLTIDHLCRIPACVNPLHMEPVTNQVNIARGVQHKVTCSRGHFYDHVDGQGRRRCLTCRRDWSALIGAAHLSLGMTHREYTKTFGKSRATAEAILKDGAA